MESRTERKMKRTGIWNGTENGTERKMERKTERKMERNGKWNGAENELKMKRKNYDWFNIKPLHINLILSL